MIIRIYLYVALPRSAENQPLPRSFSGKLRAALKRRVDPLWEMFGQWPYRHYTYQEFTGTNHGDVAIRRSAERHLTDWFAPNQVEIVDVGWGDLTSELIDEINREGHLFVIGGSGYFHFDAGWNVSGRVSSDLAFLENLRCPLVTLSVGVNRMLGPGERYPAAKVPEQSRSVMERFAGRLALSSVRDAYSHRILSELGHKGAWLLPDPALFYDQAEPVARTQGGPLRLGINLAAHGYQTVAMLEQVIDPVAGALRDIQRERPCDIVYAVHSQEESFVPQLLRRRGVRLSVVEGGLNVLIPHYRSLDANICQMLHSAILAMSAGTPTIHLAYDVKGLAFFDLMGLPDYCCLALHFSQQDLSRKLRGLLARSVECRQMIASRKAVLRAEFDRFGEAVVERTQMYIRGEPAPFSANCSPELL